MANPVNAHPMPVARSIPEDSTFLKAISYIPFLGTITSHLARNSLKYAFDQANTTSDVPRIISILNVNIHYKAADVIRNMVWIAVLASAIACDVIGSFFILGVAISVALLGNAIYEINHNRQILNQIRQNGGVPSLPVRIFF